MSLSRLIIATRESQLALWQAHFIADELRRAHHDLEVEILGMTTQGDRWLEAPLATAGGKGLFIKELEQAMMDGRAHIAVHSMKDVPARLPDGYALPVIAYRNEVRDAFVCPNYARLEELPQGACVGSSSLRRQGQLLARRPDLVVRPVRGNVNTRLAKLDAGEYDALILAATGLERLGLGDRIRERLNLSVALPAAGQGALGVECLASDSATIDRLEALVDPLVARCVLAERAVSLGLSADCATPLGAYAQLRGNAITLKAVLCAPDGSQTLHSEQQGADPVTLGNNVAQALIDQGATELMAGLE